MEEIKVKYFVDGIDELCYVAGKLTGSTSMPPRMWT